jgi:hypothetical protein
MVRIVGKRVPAAGSHRSIAVPERRMVVRFPSHAWLSPWYRPGVVPARVPSGTMARDDWFRCTVWNAEIRDAFLREAGPSRSDR